MRIRISKRSYRFIFWVPTWFIRSKWFFRRIIKWEDEIEKEKFISFLPILTRELKRYVKIMGHFDLIDVKTSDGVRIYIRV